jgi:excisionase family DNA binding protein
LAEEVVRGLRVQGQTERAAALERVLAAALASQSTSELTSAEDYLTVSQAARALAVTPSTLRGWVRSGSLPSVRRGEQVLVARESLLAYVNQLPASPAAATQSSAEQSRRGERHYQSVVEELPGEALARLEGLHARLEDGKALSKAERSELSRLERELTTAAGRRLAASLQQPSTPPA